VRKGGREEGRKGRKDRKDKKRYSNISTIGNREFQVKKAGIAGLLHLGGRADVSRRAN